MFPKQRLLYAFRNSSRKLQLESETAEVAKNISANWNPSCLRVNIEMDRPKGKYQTTSIISKEMDPNWTKEDIPMELAQRLNIQKDELTIKRFIKKDGKIPIHLKPTSPQRKSNNEKLQLGYSSRTISSDQKYL